MVAVMRKSLADSISVVAASMRRTRPPDPGAGLPSFGAGAGAADVLRATSATRLKTSKRRRPCMLSTPFAENNPILMTIEEWRCHLFARVLRRALAFEAIRFRGTSFFVRPKGGTARAGRFVLESNVFIEARQASPFPHSRCDSLAAEHQDVPVRITNLELPFPVEPLRQRHSDKRLALDAFVHSPHSLHPEVSVPQPFRPAAGQVGLLIVWEAKKHYFRSAALQARGGRGVAGGEISPYRGRE